MTILDAVKAAPHGPTCAMNIAAYDQDQGCDCDRDERIAKGIEAACVRAVQCASTPHIESPHAIWWTEVLPAFVAASRV